MSAKVVVHYHNARAKDGKSEEMGDPVSEQVSSGEVEPDIGASEDILTEKGRAALDAFVKGYGEGDGVRKWWDRAQKMKRNKDAAHKCRCGTHKK